MIHVQVNICPEYNSDKHILRNKVRKEVLKARASFFRVAAKQNEKVFSIQALHRFVAIQKRDCNVRGSSL